MENYNHHDVLVAIQLMFSAKDKDKVLKILDKYGINNFQKERFRVQLAAIKLSMGDLEQVQKYIDIALIDYRDILYTAEYSKEGLLIQQPYFDLIGK